jgi:transcriptional regulator of acetoin/glycerol metabolism
VRELAHALEAALILSGSGRVTIRGIEAALSQGGNGGDGSDREAPRNDVQSDPAFPEGQRHRRRYSFLGSEEEERSRIVEALTRWRGNKSRAARELGMARNTLRAKLKRHGLDATPPGEGSESEDSTG